MTDEHARWNELEIRRPNDVPCPTPLAWQIEKHTTHADRLLNNLLPADFPYEVERGTADDAVAVLALRESIRRDIELGTGNRVHEALLLGATWGQVAAALDITPGQAREVLRKYADGQHHMWVRNEEEGVKPFGFSADQHAAALALCEMGDDEDYSDVATADASMPRDPVELEERIAADYADDEERDAKGCTHPADEPCFGRRPSPAPGADWDPVDDNSGDGWFDSPQLDGLPDLPDRD